MEGPRAWIGLALAVAVTAALLLAAAAGAAVTVEGNFTVPPNGTATHSVPCPHGKQAASGGFFGDQGAGGLFVVASRPKASGWSATMNTNDNSPRSAGVLALCTDPKRLIVRSKHRKSGPEETNVEIDVKCPKGAHAVGGGGDVGGGARVFQNGSFPVSAGKAWGTRWRFSKGSAPSLKAFAVCDKKIRGYNVVEGEGQIQGGDVGIGSGSAFAVCEGHDRLAGGGYYRSDALTIWSRVGPAGDAGWGASGSGFTGPPILAFAVCGR